MALSKQQVGYMVAGVIGVLAITLVTLLLVNVRRANQPITSVVDQMEESRVRVARAESECQQAQDPGICLRQTVFNEAERLGQVEVCDALEAEDRDTCVRLVAQSTMNRDVCREIQGHDRDACEDAVVLLEAKEQLDPRLCAGVQDETGRMQCEETVTADVVAAGVCAEKGVDTQLCRGVDITRAAVTALDPSRCDEHAGEDARETCLEAVEDAQDAQAPEEDPDADQDGLSDTAEISLGTDPANPDSDNDGLTDGEEVEVFQTDPLNPDTDGDTFLDGTEVENGFDPNGDGSL